MEYTAKRRPWSCWSFFMGWLPFKLNFRSRLNLCYWWTQSNLELSTLQAANYDSKNLLVLRSEVSKDFRNLWQVCCFALEIILNSCACMLSHFSHVQFFAALWTVAHQAPLSMGFSRQDTGVAMPCSRGSSWPMNRTQVSYVSCIDRQILYH